MKGGMKAGRQAGSQAGRQTGWFETGGVGGCCATCCGGPSAARTARRAWEQRARKGCKENQVPDKGGDGMDCR
eukprot:3148466-Rhodomonas_salina.2